MNTQCPKCKKVFALPKEYKGQQIKCPRCKETFVPQKFKKSPIVVPSNLPRKSGNLLGKIWNNSPVAYRTGFLATLGVITALLLSIYIYGRAFPFRSSLKPKATNQYYQLYSIPSSIQGRGNMLQNLCKLLGELDLAARLKDPSLSEGTRNLLIARLNANIKFQLNIKWFGREEKTFEKAIDLLGGAIQAEIDVLIYERNNPEKCENGAWYFNKNYMQLMNKSMELRGKADWEITRLMGKI